MAHSSSNPTAAALGVRSIGDAVMSNTFADFGIPGVIIVLDALTAEGLGAFEETALTEADAWEANLGLPIDGGHRGV